MWWMRSTVAMAVMLGAAASYAEEPGYTMTVGGEPWLRTITPIYDDGTDEIRQNTNKVYTQVYDVTGDHFITKGLGGKYPHHRGLFIGWRDTKVGDHMYNTWVQTDHYQAHVKWVEQRNGDDDATATQIIEWRDAETDAPFIRERRTIRATPGRDGLRIIDFTSILTALDSDIELRGDLHHAGMQVRLANEVVDHEETTEYTLPEGAEVNGKNGVTGAWWALCSAVIQGERTWMIHMTPPDHPAGEPIYSIRPYGRFGSFTETDLAKGMPLVLTYRMVLSPGALTQAECDNLYSEYTNERNH